MNPRVSIVIPTVTARKAWLARCITAYKETTPNPEIIVVKGKRSCGEAWIEGAGKATGEYVHITADDLLPLDGWWQAAVQVADAGGVPAANVLTVRNGNGGWNQKSTMTTNSYLSGGGATQNVLVPFFSRALLDLDGQDGDEWLLPIHYGSDDWVTFLADRRGVPTPFTVGYRFGHGAAAEGRLHDSRRRDLPILCDRMLAYGPVPEPYRVMGQAYGWSEQYVEPEEEEAMVEPRVLVGAVTAYQGALGPGYYWDGPEVALPVPDTPAPAPLPIARKRKLKGSGFKVWSGSQFKDELDVLEIRLGTIGDMVDRFVIAEATVDQRGRPKELVFPKHKRRFQKWLKKIEYVIVDDMPEGEGRAVDWVRERHQRDAILRGLDGLDPDDRVLISDLDEIPTQEALAEAVADPPMRFLMDLHVYRLNWRWVDRNEQIGTLASVHLGEEFLEAKGVNQVVLHGPFRLRPDSGWHLTYQGSVEQLRGKMTGMADAFYEDLVPEAAKAGVSGPEDFLTDEWIQRSIRTGQDIYARDYRQSEWVPLEALPPYVQEHPRKFAHMLCERPGESDAQDA